MPGLRRDARGLVRRRATRARLILGGGDRLPSLGAHAPPGPARQRAIFPFHFYLVSLVLALLPAQFGDCRLDQLRRLAGSPPCMFHVVLGGCGNQSLLLYRIANRQQMGTLKGTENDAWAKGR